MPTTKPSKFLGVRWKRIGVILPETIIDRLEYATLTRQLRRDPGRKGQIDRNDLLAELLDGLLPLLPPDMQQVSPEPPTSPPKPAKKNP